ncbi:MAG TPA: tRNA pseudouridine(55) synthase TruB [Longimicrobiaceae bacterium]|nr:tRNA pseudouridine(55) synthase TruB [Longimicrobiaceae bacterium]
MTRPPAPAAPPEVAALAARGGVLPVDKPEGPTSHDAVAAVRRALRTRQVGHTGTLDPFASGLLLVCFGPATRLAEYLTALPKTYRATLQLGEATDTDDLTGETVARSDAWRSLPEERVREALASQAGERDQLPPRYSAKKVGGERMYAAARRGEEVERRPVRVVIHRLDVLEVRLPEVEFEVECGSGTYIRAIARDAGEALGVGAHLTRLRRTRVGRHGVEGAVPLDALGDAERVLEAALSPAASVAHLPRAEVDAAGAAAIGHGRAVPAPAGLPEGPPVAVLGADGALLAVGERAGDRIQPRKVLA